MFCPGDAEQWSAGDSHSKWTPAWTCLYRSHISGPTSCQHCDWWWVTVLHICTSVILWTGLLQQVYSKWKFCHVTCTLLPHCWIWCYLMTGYNHVIYICYNHAEGEGLIWKTTTICSNRMISIQRLLEIGCLLKSHVCSATLWEVSCRKATCHYREGVYTICPNAWRLNIMSLSGIFGFQTLVILIIVIALWKLQIKPITQDRIINQVVASIKSLRWTTATIINSISNMLSDRQIKL